MRLCAVLLLSLASLPAFASTNDDCKEEAIQATREAFSEKYHVGKEMTRKLPIDAVSEDAADYSYNVSINKGSNIHGIWRVVLDQQCNVKRINQIDEGVIDF